LVRQPDAWESIRYLLHQFPILGILHNFLSERNLQTETVASKIAVLLKDEQALVRMRAATALGYFFGDI